MRKDAVI